MVYKQQQNEKKKLLAADRPASKVSVSFSLLCGHVL
jgi:hypothetical protein